MARITTPPPSPPSPVESSSQTQQLIQDSLGSLKIPPEFSRYDQIVDDQILQNLHLWKERALESLHGLKDFADNLLKRISTELTTEDMGKLSSIQITKEEHAQVIFAIVPFLPFPDSSEVEIYLPEWSSTEAETTAQDVLSKFPLPTLELISYILTDILKPIYRTHPHPQINISTGRVLPPRPGKTAADQDADSHAGSYAGGASASQDFYEEQTWKESPGAGALVIWCISHIEGAAYESLWPLVVPPVMTLLDDYELRFKLQGVLAVQAMLKHVPVDVLKRTGMHALLRSSLAGCLSHLDRGETPRLLRNAISASLTLTLQCTSLGSAGRFDQLAGLLGEGIISGVWMYAEDKPAALTATIHALPEIVRALGIGTVRFLKALVPQLTHPLIPRPLVEPTVDLQLASVRALAVVIEECKPRIAGWRLTILDAVARCWVDWCDKGNKMPGDLMCALRDVCGTLADACPEIIKDEIPLFMNVDRKMFGDLFSRLPVT